jgi:integrase
MPRLNLTQKAIAKLPAPHPDGHQTVYWCDELRGFGVQCSGTTNQKLFIVQRDLPSGKTRRVSIGSVAGLALNVARKRAEDMLDELRRGIDPKHKAATFTLRKALDDYLAARPNLRPASIKLYRVVERVLEEWLDRDLNITPEMVESKHRAIAAEIGKSTANLIMRVLRIVWNFAADRATLPANPVLRLRRQWYAEPRRKRRVRDEELPAFYKAVYALPNPIARDYILLMLFTGLRRGEASKLRWTDLDLTQKIILVPAEATKGKRELEIPMSAFVHDLFVARRALGSVSAFVFPGPGASGHITSPLNALATVAEATPAFECQHMISDEPFQASSITWTSAGW